MLKGFACDVIHDSYGPVMDELTGEMLLVRLSGVHHNIMGDPMCGRLRVCTFRNRLRSWWKGLGGQWHGSERSCTVSDRLLLIFICLINVHSWR